MLNFLNQLLIIEIEDPHLNFQLCIEINGKFSQPQACSAPCPDICLFLRSNIFWWNRFSPLQSALLSLVSLLGPPHSSGCPPGPWLQQDDRGPIPAQCVREDKLSEFPVWGEIKSSHQPMRSQFLLNLSHRLVILVLLSPHQFSLGWNDVHACVCSVRSNFLQSHGL